MLKKMTLTAILVIAGLFVTAGAVSAATHAKPVHRLDVAPQVPHGFCVPMPFPGC